VQASIRECTLVTRRVVASDKCHIAVSIGSQLAAAVVHVLPSQTQVTLRRFGLVVLPRTTRSPKSGSYTAGPVTVSGTSEAIACQVVPLQIHTRDLATATTEPTRGSETTAAEAGATVGVALAKARPSQVQVCEYSNPVGSEPHLNPAIGGQLPEYGA
jgi:hypothetical protein